MVVFAIDIFRYKSGNIAVRTSSGLVLACIYIINSIVRTDISYIAVFLAVVVLYYARCPVVQNILGNPEIPDSACLDGLVCIIQCCKFNNNRGCLLARQRTDKPADIYNLAEITLYIAVVDHELLDNLLTVCFIFQ